MKTKHLPALAVSLAANVFKPTRPIAIQVGEHGRAVALRVLQKIALIQKVHVVLVVSAMCTPVLTVHQMAVRTLAMVQTALLQAVLKVHAVSILIALFLCN